VLVFFTCGSVATAPVSAATRATEAQMLEDRLVVALQQLLAGPTVDEQATGLRSWFSSDTAGALKEVRVDDAGYAEINFTDFSTVIPNASTSAGQRQLLSELEATIFQFREVTSAELQFDGNCAAFWGWLQGTCIPLERPPL
jgi:spore germination protein GerM